jgi:hypothetical protein
VHEGVKAGVGTINTSNNSHRYSINEHLKDLFIGEINDHDDNV